MLNQCVWQSRSAPYRFRPFNPKGLTAAIFYQSKTQTDSVRAACRSDIFYGARLAPL